ncbi:MAG: TIGR00730 family Rossman fold protein [Phycisphaerales bacterium JB037]
MIAVCVFCGSGAGRDPQYIKLAELVGREIARRGWRLVYGGGGIGMMGAVAQGCLDAGGLVTGIIPTFLMSKERAHPGVQEMREVGSMLERKRVMFELTDAFITLPGGLGTLDELLEALTARQLRLHDGPCALLNVNGFFDGLLEVLDRAVADEYLRQQSRDFLLTETDPNALFDRIEAALAERP